MPVFTAADRLAITRRQINSARENSAFSSTQGAISAQATALLSVDTMHRAAFYDPFHANCDAYEAEGQKIDGKASPTYTYIGSTSEVYKAAQLNSAAFFPVSPTMYTRAIPLISDGSFLNDTVRGWTVRTLTDPRYEQNILDNAGDIRTSLVQMIYRLENGITGATPTSTNLDAASPTIPAGSFASFTIKVGSVVDFAIGEKVYIYLSPAGYSGIYEVLAKDDVAAPKTLTIKSIIPSASGMGGISVTINNTIVAFTTAERAELLSGNYQEILNSITGLIFTLMGEWKTNAAAQLVQLNANIDARTTQAAQITAAKNNANTVINMINAWLALPDTNPPASMTPPPPPPPPPYAKYTATSILPISNEITTRQAFNTTRLTQIGTALGTVTQSAEVYTAPDLTCLYYQRYKWLDFRINRATGSLRRYYAATEGSTALQALITSNTALAGEYDIYFKTKAMTANDGSNILFVTDLTGINVSDTLYIVSETVGELAVTVVALMGTTQIKVSAAVPTTYQMVDIARVFKLL